MTYDADPRPHGTTGPGSTGPGTAGQGTAGPGTAGPGTTGQSSTGSLLSDALNQVTRLVRGEVQLAKAEVAQNLRSAGLGIGLLVGAVVLALVALIVLATALVGALAQVGDMGLGWAGLIVGALILLVAVILALRGANSLKPENLAPSRTVRNVQADAQMIKETTSK